MKKIASFLILIISLFAFNVNTASASGGGAIWTNNTGCSGTQDVNQYSVGDHVYIHGNNFDPNASYDWVIKKPGHNGVVVVSGTIPSDATVDGNGDFCFDAHTVAGSEGGVYQVKVGNKGDNYKVNGGGPVVTPTSTVSVCKQDTYQNLLSGWDVSLNGSSNFSGTTDDSGCVVFTGVPYGNYTTNETLKANWTNSSGNGTPVVVADPQELFNIINIEPAYITVVKHVVNDNGGDADASEFTMNVTGVTPFAGSEGGVEVVIQPGAYTVTETGGPAGYAETDSLECSGTATAGQHITCTITNDDIQPKLTVTKVVVNNNGGLVQAESFPLFVDTVSVTTGVQNGFNAGTYTVSETQQSGYLMTGITGVGCGNDGTVVLHVGDIVSCTITNDDIAPKLTVIKHVINNDYGSSVASNFTMNVTGTNILPAASFAGSESGVTVTLNAGAYSVSETGPIGYKATMTNCSGSIAIGEEKVCVIVNDDYHFWMTGGGSVITANSDIVNGVALGKVKVTHGFELNCKASLNPNNLEINWNDKTGKSHKFKLDSLTSATCTSVTNPAPPIASFSRFVGVGTGKYDGVAGATIDFTFDDNGEPGRKDTAIYKIMSGSNTVLQVGVKNLDQGNQQAHQN